LSRVRLSISGEADLLEGVNQYSSKAFSLPFSASFRMASEKSLAIGAPF
jgi:hypothetical protein